VPEHAVPGHDLLQPHVQRLLALGQERLSQVEVHFARQLQGSVERGVQLDEIVVAPPRHTRQRRVVRGAAHDFVGSVAIAQIGLQLNLSSGNGKNIGGTSGDKLRTKEVEKIIVTLQ